MRGQEVRSERSSCRVSLDVSVEMVHSVSVCMFMSSSVVFLKEQNNTYMHATLGDIKSPAVKEKESRCLI